MKPNLNPSCPGQPSPGVIRLELHQVIPAFKNRKRIAGKRLFTDKEVKQRMNLIVGDFVCQLLSAIEQNTDATPTAQSVQSWIHCWLPDDDCWTCIPEIHVTAELAPDDGATITIERL